MYVNDRYECELKNKVVTSIRRCYNSQENRVIRDMCDVAVKVLSALSGLVFHGWESPRLAGGTPTRVHSRAPRSCAYTRMYARSGRGSIAYLEPGRVHAGAPPCARACHMAATLAMR